MITNKPKEYAAWLNTEEGKKIPKTFAHQNSLPPLPIPPLEATLKKYLETVEPAVTSSEFEQTKKIVSTFLSSNEGHSLQKELELYAQTCNSKGKSWLEDWWLQMAYHIWRTPIPISSNWYTIMAEHPITISHKVCQLNRAAFLTHQILLYKYFLNNEQLPLQVQRKIPICMDQYTKIYSTTRIPGVDCDHLVTYPKEQSKHILVMSKDQIFSVNAFDDNFQPVSALDLYYQFKYIVSETHLFAEQPPIGILTAENRTTWANIRNEMIKNPQNKSSFDIIERALFIVCLDDSSPQTTKELLDIAFHNHTGKNRWFDKSFSIIMTKNGRGGCNAEHSPLDAPALAHGAITYATDCESDESYLAIQQHANSPRPNHLPQPFKIKWEIDSKIQDALRISQKNVIEWIESYYTDAFVYSGFGSDFLKEVKLSPDAFIQMVIQLTYYRIHHQCTPTYETAQTRRFFHGRTETVRTLSNDSKAFVTIMDDEKAATQSKFQALQKAINSHVKYMVDASNGLGIDRHLLGLQLIAHTKGLPPPAIFTDPSYSKSRTYRLSTSNLTPSPVSFGGFGPITDDGYGVSYALRNTEVWFSVSTKVSCHITDSNHFIKVLNATLNDLRTLSLTGQQSHKNKL